MSINKPATHADVLQAIQDTITVLSLNTLLHKQIILQINMV